MAPCVAYPRTYSDAMSEQRAEQEVRKVGEPIYRMERHTDDFDIRLYESYLVAEVIVPGPAEAAGGAAFQLLSRYIFGDNHGAKKLEMTAPVTQSPVTLPMTAPVTLSATESGFRVQFVMPPGYTLATLPVPNNSRIVLREVPARRVAVRRYSGRWTETNYAAHLSELRDAMRMAGIPELDAPILSRYNGPYVLPFLRRNEVWIPIA
jgi:SOUL heme-binding protein